jgi:hypothetical protein
MADHKDILPRQLGPFDGGGRKAAIARLWTDGTAVPTVPADMEKGGYIGSRRAVALIAAYIVALQALLLPLSVAAAAPFAPHLCTATADNGSDTPAGPLGGCPCAAGCGLHGWDHGFVLPQPSGVTPAFDGVDARPALLAPSPVVCSAVWRPQIARGPPAA